MRKVKKGLAALAAAALLLWGAMFFVDYRRSMRLERPLFARPVPAADISNPRTYRGIGYRVEVREREDTPNPGIASVEMWAFDRVVSASIT